MLLLVPSVIVVLETGLFIFMAGADFPESIIKAMQALMCLTIGLIPIFCLKLGEALEKLRQGLPLIGLRGCGLSLLIFLANIAFLIFAILLFFRLFPIPIVF